MKSFWIELASRKKPFFVLAPMEDVTDTVFRRVVGSVCAPDVYFTEFTSVEGLFSKGGKKVGRRLDFTESEHPIIAQIWGLEPENFYKAAKLLCEKGFDGIDINMGCPDSGVTAKGACSALIKNPSLAKEIIAAVKKGAGDLPVSVKTRIGYQAIQTEEWIGFLLEQNLDALTIHARTVKEMSKVRAHWEEIQKAVAIRNGKKSKTVIIGNGDVISMQDGVKKAAETGCEGIMVGRGIFENIWFFDKAFDKTQIIINDRLRILKQHVVLYESHADETLPFPTLKKYFKIYLRDFDGASEMRTKFMETQSLAEVKKLLTSYK